MSRLNPDAIGRPFQWEGRTGQVIGSRKTRSGVLHLIVRFEDGSEKAFCPSRADIAEPSRFEVRRKTFDFHAAPDLVEPDAYVSAIVVSGQIEKGGRFPKALDAAQDAARRSHEAIRDGRTSIRSALVGCAHEDPRPRGAMKGFMPVSYRPR